MNQIIKQNVMMATMLLWSFINFGACDYSIKQILNAKEEVDELYFAPDEVRKFKEDILWLCAQTKKSIKASFYRLTDRDIAQALIVAHERGVFVEVVVDPSAISSLYSLVNKLFKAGISVYCYQPTGLLPPFPRAFPTIMHHKHIIFSEVQGEYNLVACGSLNYTTAGFNGNQEQMQIRTKKVEQFENHFECLKQRSRLVTQEHFIRIKKPTVKSRMLAHNAFCFVRRALHLLR